MQKWMMQGRGRRIGSWGRGVLNTLKLEQTNFATRQRGEGKTHAREERCKA